MNPENLFSVLKSSKLSPDVYPIQNFWDVVEIRIRMVDVYPTDTEEFQESMIEAGTKISKSYEQHPIRNMNIMVVLYCKRCSKRNKAIISCKLICE